MTRASSSVRSAAAAAVALSIALGATAPAGAVPAPAPPVVPGSGRGDPARDAPRDQRIGRVTAALDTRTGVWTTTTRFAGRRTAANDAELTLGLGFYGDLVFAAVPTITVRTAPGAAAPVYRRVTPPQEPATAPTVEPSPIVPTARYNRSGTTLTVSVRDPSLAGRPRPERVDGSLRPVGDPARELGGFTASMGLPAPRATIDPADDRIVVNHSGRFSLRLRPLTSAAQQQIILFLPGGYTLASTSLPAGAFRHRAVNVRVEADRLYRLQPGGNPHRALLRIVTYQRFGVSSVSARHVTIRRR
ncbi:hypothetical protein AB0L40_04005 [Patulibacter sp. NPDC049589]|uniref:hypothetical protein n=1 Tax=Patulibacter sp. NPDC049589 TaxID=3154731 RepID=UPI00343C26E0